MLNETEIKCTYASNMDDRADPLVMPLDLLQCITNNFSEERILGSSAYGTVYMVRFTYVVHAWPPYITNIIHSLRPKKDVEDLLKLDISRHDLVYR
jgi:hypothetical protein